MYHSSKHQVLIVDDDLSVRDSVAMLLASEGDETSTTENGLDALLQMKSKVPELIVPDLNIPQMSGFEFLSVVRRRFPRNISDRHEWRRPDEDGSKSVAAFSRFWLS